jgi:hypothetical protein
MALQGDHKVIIDSIKHHSSNPTVVAHGFQTLQAIAKLVCHDSKLYLSGQKSVWVVVEYVS